MRATSLKTDLLVAAGLLALCAALVASHRTAAARLDPRLLGDGWLQLAELVPMALGSVGLRDLRRQGFAMTVDALFVYGVAVLLAAHLLGVPLAMLTLVAAALLGSAFAFAMGSRLRR